MRLWHHEIIPFLPKSQLLAQWRELNSIFAKEDNHVLINYIYDYPKSHLYRYTNLVLNEMNARKINVRTYDKMNNYFQDVDNNVVETPYEKHHDHLYLTICYYNLYEKYLRGQKDYSQQQFELLHQYYIKKQRGQ